MIIKEEFLSRLQKIFDLNLYETKVWTALLSRGVSTAGEISNIGEVPRSRTYDVLESLEKKGFTMMKLGKPIKFIALKPADVIERVKRNMFVIANEKAKRLDELKSEDVVKELESLFSGGLKYIEPHELSGVLRGRKNIHNHLDTMIGGAEKNITIVTSISGLNRKVESLINSLEKAHKKGVKIRIAAPISKKNYDAAKNISKIAEVRSLDNFRARFVIADSKELLFMVLDDESVHPSYDIGVWINTNFFSGALEGLFGLAWQRMTPLSKVKI